MITVISLTIGLFVGAFIGFILAAVLAMGRGSDTFLPTEMNIIDIYECRTQNAFHQDNLLVWRF